MILALLIGSGGEALIVAIYLFVVFGSGSHEHVDHDGTDGAVTDAVLCCLGGLVAPMFVTGSTEGPELSLDLRSPG